MPSKKFLPMTPEETAERGWDAPDVVLVTGDAYVDHPSFAMAVIGRVLESAGYRVALLAQPAWTSASDFRKFGRPKLFFGVSAGNMDSMINKYTHNRRIRSGDDYSPGGRAGLRPDRASIIYSQRAREAYPDVPIVLGGIEASMRRFAHYDYWSDKVRKSVLLDSKADLLVYGMGERPVLEIAGLLKAGVPVERIRGVRGTAYAVGRNEAGTAAPPGAVTLPSFEETAGDRVKFSTATRLIHEESNPYCARPLVQFSDTRAVVQNPPSMPLTTEELDRIYDLPYARERHPSYREPVPALETVKDSIVIHRGCFGGCAFCSLGLHQGRFIQSRSRDSVLRETVKVAGRKDFSGFISDLGAPSANMYRMAGRDKALCESCRRYSCLHPAICRNLDTGHGHSLDLLRSVRKIKGVKKAFVASGIRMDLALLCPEYIDEIAAFHTSGQLKVAPEHSSPGVLARMRKPVSGVFLEFAAAALHVAVL
ncbi:MAG TPA: YgiQ family radical SAM protein, partial [Elusimicrobiales bacterium]|nr:YgiQ family radical SAM protein [Elusimicrobiales bacterium]